MAGGDTLEDIDGTTQMRQALADYRHGSARRRGNLGIKVQPGNATTLCATCTRGTMTVDKHDHRHVWCHAIEKPVFVDIVQCNSHSSKRTTTLYEMKQIAWVITTDEKKNIGFRPLSLLKGEERKRMREELDDLDSDL